MGLITVLIDCIHLVGRLVWTSTWDILQEDVHIICTSHSHDGCPFRLWWAVSGRLSDPTIIQINYMHRSIKICVRRHQKSNGMRAWATHLGCMVCVWPVPHLIQDGETRGAWFTQHVIRIWWYCTTQTLMYSISPSNLSPNTRPYLSPAFPPANRVNQGILINQKKKLPVLVVQICQYPPGHICSLTQRTHMFQHSRSIKRP